MDNIALQLFSIDDISKEKGLHESLKIAHCLGYEGVEFAGYFGMSVDEIKKELEKYNLKVAGAHFMYDALTKEYDSIIGSLKDMGAFSVCVPYASFDSAEKWADFGKKLNELGKEIRKDGLLFGYHNHTHEYKEFSVKRAVDIIFENCEPENVFFELDTRHAAVAKAAPELEAKKYAGRIPVLHARDTDMQDDCAVGAGVVDFKSVTSAANGIRWFVVENENFGKNLGQLEESAKFLKSL